MTVACNVELKPVGQERFHAVDRAVMKHAFDIHNAMGRFCDELVYQDELANRCNADGLAIDREVHVRVSHEGFSKPYYLDMLVEHGIIYELKTVERLSASHQGQLINYLLLTDIHHGKLLNFRPSSIESRFVSARMDREDRTSVQIDDRRWLGVDEPERCLREILTTLLSDWGAFLDVNLYRDALLHFTAGPGAGIQPVVIRVDGRIVGSQHMCLLCNGTAWHISTLRGSLTGYETHLVRLLRHTALEKMHWINLNHRTITLQTLTK